MSSLSRSERLIALLGGTENLPHKTKQAGPSPDTLPDEHPTQILQKGEDVSQWHRAGGTHELPPSSRDVQQDFIQSQPSSSLERVATFAFESRKGEPAIRGVRFCPFGAVTKYCYKFVPAELSQSVATAFFDANKIYDHRTWDL